MLPKLPKLVIGEGAGLHFIRPKLARAGARGQIDDGALQSDHVLFVRVADHRHDQPVFQSATAIPRLMSR